LSNVLFRVTKCASQGRSRRWVAEVTERRHGGLPNVFAGISDDGEQPWHGSLIADVRQRPGRVGANSAIAVAKRRHKARHGRIAELAECVCGSCSNATGWMSQRAHE
jgi:hypothetical protein